MAPTPDAEVQECAGPASPLCSPVEKAISVVYNSVMKRNEHQGEFLQAFKEVFFSVRPLLCLKSKYINALDVIAEPERCITFRVSWFDDLGNVHVNRGYRVQYSSALGPYKGGLRFHPSVNMSVVKFLGFEQIFKNALTGLAMGGGKGGSDFDPKGKSETEVMRFCQSFMTELYRHIGPARDVPAGDIGVGCREIGYLFGQYKRLSSLFEGALTGKDLSWGGSQIRPEATGYGCVYFVLHVYSMLLNQKSLEGKPCVISGSGNVAMYCAEKLVELGARVLTFSDSSGYILKPDGFTIEDVKIVQEKKIANPNTRVSEFTKSCVGSIFHAGQTPWRVPCEIAFPCATQNEIHAADAEALIASGCKVVAEGANMPTTLKALDIFKLNKVIVCPAKAANAGGVAVSGLEMSQNAMLVQWPREEVDQKLKLIMADIFTQCHETAKQFCPDDFDLMTGANISAFIKVADAVIAQGYA